MKKSSPKKSTIEPAADFLLPDNLEGMSALVASIIATPAADVLALSSAIQIQSAKRLAWCEITDAENYAARSKTGGDSPRSEHDEDGSLASQTGLQRKLTAIVNDLIPPLYAFRIASIKAAEIRKQHDEVASDPLVKEFHDLKKRDVRTGPQAQTPNINVLYDELDRIRQVIESGNWRTAPMDFRQDRLNETLAGLHSEQKYFGECSMEGAEKRIAALEAEIPAAEQALENALDSDECQRLIQLAPIIEKNSLRLAEIAGMAALLDAEEKAAREDLQLKVEAAMILAEGLIKAHGILCNEAA